ncbi:MAG TPA: ATPase domain-containing protein, partial [Arenibaculum sp.]|nr:ATPase domain-containing protein [Arenibaculum sp.]
DLDAMVNGGALEIAWQPLAENLVDALGHRLLNAVRRRRIRYLFVDGINGIRASMVYENRLPLLLNALNNVLRGEDVTILYTHEIEKLSLPTDLTTDHLSAMVDNVVVLHLAMKDDVIRRRISVLKMRDSDFDPLTYEFHVSDGGIVFGPHPASISNRTHAMFYGRSQE